MTPQSSFMIVVPIIADRREALQVLLDSMNVSDGQVDPDNGLIPFGRFETLHSARLVIIESNVADDIRAFGVTPYNWPASLAILGEVDGEREQILAQLAVRASHGLAQLFRHCTGFEAHQGPLLQFLVQHSTKSAATYVNWIGRTVQQIHEDAKLQAVLAARLALIIDPIGRDNPRQLRQQLLIHVQLEMHHGRLSLTPPARTPWRYRWRNAVDLISFPCLLLLLTPLLLVSAPFLFWRLRTVERSDPDIDIRPEQAHIRKLSSIEDLDVTNQFIVFGDVKPGLFRHWLLRSILRVAAYTTQHIYRRGFLARIRTIHFARWVFLNDGRSMLFASIYDGSLDSYMDDFINKVAFGLNLIFSHFVGYPRSRWMIKGGAELEQPYKDTLRRAQLPSAVWYRAYPGMTVFDLERNARVRHGVEQYPQDDHSIRQWLSEI